MEKVLGRKQSIRNEDWINAMQHIEDLVKKEELDVLVDQTVSEILEQTEGKKVAFAWSGGKDSLVLEKVCEMAGIHDCLMAVCDLEYPAFVEWVESHKPKKLEIINTGQDMDWLLKHQNMLFPQKSNVAAQWFHMVQHRGQARYYKAHDLDMLLLGRRRADGNYVGKGSNIYTDGKGVGLALLGLLQSQRICKGFMKIICFSLWMRRLVSPIRLWRLFLVPYQEKIINCSCVETRRRQPEGCYAHPRCERERQGGRLLRHPYPILGWREEHGGRDVRRERGLFHGA